MNSGSHSIEYEGQTVLASFRRRAVRGLIIRLRWISKREALVQGVQMSLKGGKLHVEGTDTTANRLVLWTDTAPDEVVIRCEGKKLGELFLWNCWRDERHGSVQALVLNAGMIVEERGAGVYRFHCNSGWEVTFKDLTFDVAFEEPE